METTRTPLSFTSIEFMEYVFMVFGFTKNIKFMSTYTRNLVPKIKQTISFQTRDFLFQRIH